MSFLRGLECLKILTLFYFFKSNFHYIFLLPDHVERVSAELGDYGSYRTDSESAYKENPLQ